MKVVRRVLLILVLTPLLLFGGYLIYAQTLIGVHPKTVAYYQKLSGELRRRRHSPNYFILTTIRPRWLNELLRPFGAAPFSRHVHAEAVDLIVLDVNGDWSADAKDVDIVYDVLNRVIVRDGGGVGTYKGEPLFLQYQMIHFDCRGHRARWHR